ncbi:hypothetical protein F8M41_006524 [Gigaspora margarita]|uniref:Uncharacterized protein n=1 Tax=Gigaspora margarita TaxID=4874 RepID=A0A8H4AWP3_GIGMA|nr:hypothetical protein F8M41_006524 [Gigaspora margarita]
MILSKQQMIIDQEILILNQKEDTNVPTTTTKSQDPNLGPEKIASMTPTQPQDLTLTKMNMTSQPNPEVNKQPDMEELEEEIQGSEQDEQNSRDKQTGPETAN